MLIDKVDTCMLIDIGLRFYAVHTTHLDDLEVRVTDLEVLCLTFSMLSNIVKSISQPTDVFSNFFPCFFLIFEP